MSLQQRSYSVLVVSASEHFNKIMKSLLSGSTFEAVKYTGSISGAKRANVERLYDIVIIDTPLPDDTGDNFAVDISSAQPSIVLMLVHHELYDMVHENYCEHGVFITSKPASREDLSLALDWLISARERIRKYEKKALSTEEKMQEIRLVNRAKLFLITEKGMGEDDAHRYISKQAMDRCVSKRAIAEEILNTL